MYKTTLVLSLLSGIFVADVNASCPPLSPLENGRYVAIPGRPDKVKIVCDPAYEYMHPRYPHQRTMITVTCLRGKWNDEKPECFQKPNTCLPPTPPENGGVMEDPPYSGGDVVTFICDEGYYKKGPDTATCQKANYEWDGDAPRCISYDSQSLEEIAKQLESNFVDEMGKFSMGRAIDGNVERNGLDLFMAFDKSSSIPPSEFVKGIEFAKFLVSKFNVTNGGQNLVGKTRLSVYTFGTEMKKEISLDDVSISSTQKAIQKLDTIRCGEQCEGGTNMGHVLSNVHYVVTKQARPQAKKALFITSDGEPTYDPGQKPVSEHIKALKLQEVEIFTVGIGTDINEEFLSSLSTLPKEEHVFHLKEFDDLNDIVRIIRQKAVEPTPPPLNKCGYVSPNHKQNISAIKDGDLKLGQWPWLAAIIVQESITKGSRYACDGVLICERWVLTSAQCMFDKDGKQLPPEKVNVVVGSNNLVQYSDHEQQFYAVNVVINWSFNLTAKLRNSDLALIELNEGVKFNDYVKPVCIMSEILDESSRPDSVGIIIGWLIRKEEDGRLPNQPIVAAQPSQAKLSVSAINSCNVYKPANYNCEDGDIFNAVGRDTPGKLCANLNMGSPFLMTSGNRFHVAAVASYIEGCYIEKKSVMLTRVRFHDDWIRVTTEHCQDDYM